jgi:hypothetical protein
MEKCNGLVNLSEWWSRNHKVKHAALFWSLSDWKWTWECYRNSTRYAVCDADPGVDRIEREKPILLYINNKGMKDLANNWSVGGLTHHVEVQMYFLRELKEQDLICCVWKSGPEMCSDLFTKNLPRDVFKKHTMVYCGPDEYMKSEVGNIQVWRRVTNMVMYPAGTWMNLSVMGW